MRPLLALRPCACVRACTRACVRGERSRSSSRTYLAVLEKRTEIVKHQRRVPTPAALALRSHEHREPRCAQLLAYLHELHRQRLNRSKGRSRQRTIERRCEMDAACNQRERERERASACRWAASGWASCVAHGAGCVFYARPRRKRGTQRAALRESPNLLPREREVCEPHLSAPHGRAFLRRLSSPYGCAHAAERCAALNCADIGLWVENA